MGYTIGSQPQGFVPPGKGGTTWGTRPTGFQPPQGRSGRGGSRVGTIGNNGAAGFPVTPKASAPSTGATSSTPGQPSAPSPYDSTYWIQLADATNKANNQINGFNSDIANAGTNLQSTLGVLGQQNALNLTNAQNAENAKGGFAQGALGRQEGLINQASLETRSADTQKEAQQVASWNSAIAGARQGLSIETIALGLASAARQSALAAQNPTTLASNPTAPKGSGGAPLRAAPRGPRVTSSRNERRSSGGRNFRPAQLRSQRPRGF